MSKTSLDDVVEIPAPTRILTISHTKDASFTNSFEDQIKQQEKVIESLNNLKTRGHDITDEEIFEAEAELLVIIRSRGTKRALAEIDNDVNDNGENTSFDFLSDDALYSA